MNRCINLPAKAIETLISTDKHAVILSEYPRDFNPVKDQLIIYDADTKEPFGIMRSPIIYRCRNFIRVWWQLRKKLAYNDRKFLPSVFSRRVFYVYVFTDYVRFRTAKNKRKKAVQ